MIKNLTPIGERLGLIIDQQILDRLHIDGHTPLEVTIENDGIVIRPVAPGAQEQERFVDSAKRMMEIHQETFRKLAE